MTSPDELLPVTQADRDAAARAYHAIAKGYMQVIGCAMEAGAADHAELVQLFARHRQSHPLPGDVGMLAAGLERAAQWHDARCKGPPLAGGLFLVPFEVAAAETERLQNELDITNADHVALWLEANLPDASLAWLACRIVEAHEAHQGAGEP